MELTPVQLQWLRDELGAKPDNEALQARYAVLGSVRDVALAEYRARRAKLLSQPLTANVSGVASVNYAENVKAIERRIASLERLDDDPTDTPGEDVDGGGADLVDAYRLHRGRGR